MKKIIIYLFFVIATCISACIAFRLHQNSILDKKIKSDYYKVNQIKYGLLSGDKWTQQVSAIIQTQVDSFKFTPSNKKVIQKQVDNILNRLLDEVDTVLHKKQEKLVDRIKFGMINSVVDIEKFRKEIPRFSNSILEELDKTENKKELKQLLQEKVSSVLKLAAQDTTDEQMTVMRSYGTQDLFVFNELVSKKTLSIWEEQEKLGYMLIIILTSILFLWLLLFKWLELHAVSFLFSVLISFLALFIGISLPMIEIDARISILDLQLLSSHIIFKDQVIFFQTKSILDVIHILLQNGKTDAILVGALVFLFSVLFPVTKLICTTIYLFSKKDSNRFVRYMAFKSGKWSMADVMVVAIFMAYVGFRHILDDQLADITVQKESINLLTTNRTSLQTGFVLFVAFVLFNLALSEILKKISRNRSISQK